MLTIDNLTLQKNNKTIFKSLGFSCFVGSCLEINGKNGSGKTSLLKIIAGISKQTSGKILWDEQDIQDFRSDFNADLQYLGHKNFLKQDFSVYENLNFFASLYESEMLINTALSYFKILDLANEKVKNLSCGTQKKVILSKLLICHSTIWILDEPFANLDEEGKKLLKGLIKTKIENRGVVIISSHENNSLDFSAKINIENFN